MSGPINETHINAGVKESGFINKLEACYTAVLKLSECIKSTTQWCLIMTNIQQHIVISYTILLHM